MFAEANNNNKKLSDKEFVNKVRDDIYIAMTEAESTGEALQSLLNITFTYLLTVIGFSSEKERFLDNLNLALDELASMVSLKASFILQNYEQLFKEE